MKKHFLLLLISMLVIGLFTACGDDDEEKYIYNFEDNYNSSFSIGCDFIKAMDETYMSFGLFETKKGNSTIQFGSITGTSAINLSPYAHAQLMMEFNEGIDRFTDQKIEKVDGYKYECAVYKAKITKFDEEQNTDQLYNEVMYFIADGFLYYQLNAVYTDKEATKYEKAIKSVMKSFEYENNEVIDSINTKAEIASAKIQVPEGYIASSYDYSAGTDSFHNIVVNPYHSDDVSKYIFNFELSVLADNGAGIEKIAQEEMEEFENKIEFSSVTIKDTTLFEVPAYCVSTVQNYALWGFNDEYETLNYYFQINDTCYQLVMRGTTPGKTDIKDFDALLSGIEFK